MSLRIAWSFGALLAGALLALVWWGWQEGGLALMQLGFNC